MASTQHHTNDYQENKNELSSRPGNGASRYGRCVRNVFYTKRKTNSGVPKLSLLPNHLLDFNPF